MGEALGQTFDSSNKVADDAILDAMVLSACADGMMRVERGWSRVEGRERVSS
jgi:hypothetical protein